MNDLTPHTGAPDRTKFVGGSDIAAILGISPWRTPLQLWQDKVTPRVEDGRERQPLTRGKRWESVVAEMLVERLEREGRKVEIVASNRRYVDPRIPFFACEIDFEVRLDGAEEITNVELKTVHPFKAKEWGESGTDEAPLWYVAQAMWGLGITGRQECLIAPLFGADELLVFPVARDDDTIQAMRQRAGAFWTNHVIPAVPPEPMTAEDVALLFPTESAAPALLADEELTEKALRLRAIDREMKARQAEWDALEFQIKRAMKDCGELVVGEKSAITWKEKAHGWLDQAALKEAHPEIHKKFFRRGSSRQFLLKSFAWKE